MELPFIHIIKKTNHLSLSNGLIYFLINHHEKIQDNSINKITYELTNKSLL